MKQDDVKQVQKKEATKAQRVRGAIGAGVLVAGLALLGTGVSAQFNAVRVQAADKCVVKAGDSIMKIDSYDLSSSYTVTKIDDKGIVVEGRVKVPIMDEITNLVVGETKPEPYTVKFGETKKIEPQCVAPLTVKVEKGSEPGTAVVTVTVPEEYIRSQESPCRN